MNNLCFANSNQNNHLHYNYGKELQRLMCTRFAR